MEPANIIKHDSADSVEPISAQTGEKEVHVEHIQDVHQNYTYDDAGEEPELRATTWIALGSMCLLILAVLFALQGPPTVVSGGNGSCWRQYKLSNVV
jgi:hypothetical protein